MDIEIFQFNKDSGWSVKQFPPLDSTNTLLLSFYSPDFKNNPEPLQLLKKSYPHALFAGCSTSGEIHENAIHDHSISTAVIKFDKSKIKMITQDIADPNDSFQVGKTIAEKLQSNDLKAVFILSDGLCVNGSALVEGMKSILPKEVIVTGGLAGDGKNFKCTSVLKNDLPASQCVNAIGFYGDSLQFGFGSKGGWDIFGSERLITRSKGNILYEIDGEPALELYKKYLGDKATDLPASALLFPLAIKEKPLSKTQVVRTILAVNEADQSLTFAGDIPQGWYAQLMRANFDRLIEGACDAGRLAQQPMAENKPCLGIAISCVGRRLVLGERSEEEIEATIEKLGSKTPLIGFYSYGEISPSGLSNCDLHNQTMTLTTISEK